MDCLKQQVVVMFMLMLHVGVYGTTKESKQLSLWERAKSALTVCTDQIKKDLISGAELPDTQLSVKDHFLHGLRLYGYNLSVKIAICSLRTSGEAVKDPNFKNWVVSSPWSMLYVALVGPVLEEAVYTYGIRLTRDYGIRLDVDPMYNNKAQFFAPILFGLAHTQYDEFLQLACGLMNFIHHRSLITRKEYAYGPYISHILHNVIVLGCTLWRSECN